MPIQVVTVISGTEQLAGEGQTQPFRALVRFRDKTVRAGYVKVLPPEGVAAEAFCALLLRGWGLNIPEPAICDAPFGFVSIDVGYPNLKQHIGWSESFPQPLKDVLARHGAMLVASFPDTPRALAADEAIDNKDRNLGNILWDGQQVAWIDHERSLGLVPQPDANKLATMAIVAGMANEIQRSAVAVSLTLGPQVVSDAAEECSAMASVAGFADAVARRLPSLAQRVLSRFPRPVDLFSQP